MTGKLFAPLRVFWNQKVLLNVIPGIFLGIFLPGLLFLLILPSSPGYAQKADIPQRLTGERWIEAMTRLDYLLDGQTAIRLLPAEMIIGQGVTQAEWSPDGRFVLAVRIPSIKQPTFAVPVSIAIWNKTTWRSAELWSRRLAAPMLAGKTQWMAKGQVGLFRWRWMEADESGNWGIKEGMVRVNAAQGVAREVAVDPGDNVEMSPSQPGGVILHGRLSFVLYSVRVIAPDGSISPVIPMPEGTLACTQTRWQADGKQFYMELNVPAVQDKSDGAKIKDQVLGTPGVKKWFAVEMMPPRLVPMDKEPADALVLPGSIPSSNALTRVNSSALRVKSVKTILKQGDVEARITSLWLETGGAKPMSALLCADGEGAQVSPLGDAALYLAQTGVCVTPLQRMPRALFTSTVLATHQDDVKYRAWEVAQAVNMWNSTHKGVLPVPDAAIASLQSFISYERDYEGFRYVWKGGALPASVRSAETVIAEIVGPGGCTQIFADGHVAWKSSD